MYMSNDLLLALALSRIQHQHPTQHLTLCVMFQAGDGAPNVTVRLLFAAPPLLFPLWTLALGRCRSETIIMLVELQH